MSWFFKSKEAEILYCQLAHGSPIGIIDNFTNIQELYSNISKCYNINAFDILYCTFNTHKVNMSQLISQAPTEPIKGIISAHIKGRTKIVEITKTKPTLGITFCSNGAGYCIIETIEPGSDLHVTPQVCVGDHIEEINEINGRGKNNEEIKMILKAFQRGSTFVLKLVEPMKAVI